MLLWLAENWGTLAVGALIVLIAALAVRSLVKGKKRSRQEGCSGGCAGCPMCGSCHPGAGEKP